MSSTPTVSINIAAYNYGHFLAAALDSVLAQTFTDWEAIVVDDGSTDNTQEVIRPYLADHRVQCHRTENRGQPAAENTGIKLSRGRFVAFLDADDLWLAQKLEKQLALFRDKPELAVVYCDRLTINPEGDVVPRAKRRLWRGRILEEMFRDNFVTFSSSVVRRDVLEEMGGFDESCRHASDYELWLRVATRYDFDYVDEPLMMYRTGHANLTSRSDAQLLTALRIMDRFVDQYGGDKLLNRSSMRRAYAETYLHLGQHYAQSARIKALRWYARALAKSPASLKTWKELMKLGVPEAILRLIYERRHPRDQGLPGAGVVANRGPSTDSAARNVVDLP